MNRNGARRSASRSSPRSDAIARKTVGVVARYVGRYESSQTGNEPISSTGTLITLDPE
jgi:hypothetical protein